MRNTYLLLIIGMLLYVQCDKLSLVKKSELRQLDTVVNFSSVDLSPSFSECNAIIEKDEKSACFRKTIHEKIGASLQKHTLESVYDISETITVDLLVTSSGIIKFQQIHHSEDLVKTLPDLDSILKLCINDLPKIFPATKRGIPVTTKYQLPINIKVNNN